MTSSAIARLLEAAQPSVIDLVSSDDEKSLDSLPAPQPLEEQPANLPQQPYLLPESPSDDDEVQVVSHIKCDPTSKRRQVVLNDAETDLEEVAVMSCTPQKPAEPPCSPTTPHLSIEVTKQSGEDITVVAASRGVLALADYPHMRFQCAVYAFQLSKTQGNLSYCPKCYCYACDVPASECSDWLTHAHANDKVTSWRSYRARKKRKPSRKDDECSAEHINMNSTMADNGSGPTVGSVYNNNATTLPHAHVFMSQSGAQRDFAYSITESSTALPSVRPTLPSIDDVFAASSIFPLDMRPPTLSPVTPVAYTAYSSSRNRHRSAMRRSRRRYASSSSAYQLLGCTTESSPPQVVTGTRTALEEENLRQLEALFQSK